jgi:hypothetical protein
MADEFLLTYSCNDFQVLVQAEVKARHPSAKPFAARPVAWQPDAAAPWRTRGPPPEPAVGPKAAPKRSVPSVSQAKGESATQPQAAAMAALLSLQTAAPKVLQPPKALQPPTTAVPAAAPAAAPPASVTKAVATPAPTGKAPALKAAGAVAPATAGMSDAVGKATGTKRQLPSTPKEGEVDYLRRRLHNSQRAGRNRTYYDVLNRLGPAEAAKYWVPRSSSSTENSNPPS